MGQKKSLNQKLVRWLTLLLLVTGAVYFIKTRIWEPKSWEWHQEAAVKAYYEKDYLEAEEEWMAALAVAEQFRPEDIRLTQTLHNLIEVLDIQSKYSESEGMIRRVIAMDEASLGPDHPNVAASLYNLAENFRKRGEFDRAEPLYQRALKIWRDRLGEDSFLVVESRKRYLLFLKEAGRMEEAVALESQTQGISPEAEQP